jgi:hypothetical protein
MRQDFESPSFNRHFLPANPAGKRSGVKDGELVRAAGCMGKDGFFDDLKIWNAEPSGAK